jgi:flavin-dependent dehydrogenase
MPTAKLALKTLGCAIARREISLFGEQSPHGIPLPAVGGQSNGLSPPGRIVLPRDATVAVVGGGPAGAFFAIHLLRKARDLGTAVQVLVIERKRQSPGLGCPGGAWQGCNGCAGGLSPRLNDELRRMGLTLPAEVIQSRIHSITIQGYWKNIELGVPDGREMLAVYRGTRPANRSDRSRTFDSFLLDEARRAGAELIAGDVQDVRYSGAGKPLLRYRQDGVDTVLEADLAVLATGANASPCGSAVGHPNGLRWQQVLPGFIPPRVRRALIFELETAPGLPVNLDGAIHFVEYGSKSLRLEMCSLVPKRGYLTVVLVGPSVDAVKDAGENRELIHRFLALPHIRKLMPRGAQLPLACVCNPQLVVGSARHPFADRIAVVGDSVTARLYKDGILSAEQTARALADTVLTLGVDAGSLRRGYGPTLERFQRDNRFASLVFAIHRLFFSSSVLSRVLYQAVLTERKGKASPRRRLEQILWRIASGDDQYEAILRSMIHPATIWLVLVGGLLVTLRSYLTELVFGLRWEGFGRFTTGVAKERLEAKRTAFSRLLQEARIPVPERFEFERMYSIRIQAAAGRILEQLGRFGEADRGYLRPRWIHIHRIAGARNAPGCVIRYEVLGHRLAFSLVLEQVVDERLAVYRVRDGFARGGVLIFEIERLAAGVSTLSIYVAFNFARGRTWAARPFWWLFRRLFPAFVHDVLWNHSLCQLKDLVEVQG